MIKSEFLAKLASFWFFSRWHPEVALRYLPIVEEINKFGKKATILEVGSGGLGIAPYLRRMVTGVDVTFIPPFHPLLRRVKSSATKLPFADSSFDIVISVDMLEHLNNEERIKAISEMLRVVRKKLLLAVPCGKNAYQQDLYLDGYFQKQMSRRYCFFEQQVTFGLPEEKDIYDTIQAAAKKREKTIRMKVLGNENLRLRLFLMKGFITRNFLVDIFFRKIFLFIIPILRLFNNEPTYRKLFFVNIISP